MTGGGKDREKKEAPLSKVHLETLLEQIKSVRYGSITLTIQDGLVIQLDKIEKIRLVN